MTDDQRVAPTPSPQQRDRPRSERLEDRIAELEAAVAKTPDDWEPDGSEDQSQHRPDQMIYTPPPSSRATTRRISRITLLQETKAASADPAENEPATQLSEPEVEAVVRDTVAEVVSEHSAFDAALKQAVSDSVADEAATAPKPDVAEPKSAPAEAETPTAPTPVAPAAVMETRATAVVDEAQLRKLVNRLLREELQGEIGERITRNVRKLVRQEIQRALTVQDLD
ncbi:MAG: hypothetical protein AAF762_07425 [Pseudomonadota bacterium]